MFNWEKMGLFFSPQDHNTPDWMKEFAQAPSVLLFDDFIRIYFSTRPNPDFNGQYISYSGFIDVDKNDLKRIIRISQKPILKLGELGCFDEFGTYPVSVIRHNDEIRAYYAGWTRCESVPFNVAIGLGISKNNGESFDKLGNGPIISYSLEEPFVISGPKIRFFNNMYYLFYISGTEWILDNNKPEPIYKIRLAISNDGVNFKKVNKNLVSDKIDFYEAQASPDVFYKNGFYHMFFCYRGGRNYRNKENGYRIGYAKSIDLLNWERNDEIAGISVSKSGWDSEMISYPHLFEIENDVYMFYLGNGVGKKGFGLAKLISIEV